MFKSDPFDFCDLTSGRGGKKNPMYKMFFESTKKMAPDFFHKCPYVGVHAITNWKFARQMLLVHPTGNFRVVATTSDGNEVFCRMFLEYTMT
jgi:hypothetical protein